jgi:hypothetical protein
MLINVLIPTKTLRRKEPQTSGIGKRESGKDPDSGFLFPLVRP